MSGNLNANNTDGAEKITTMTIYDNKGSAHELKLKFAFVAGDSTATPPTSDSYNLTGSLDGINLILNQNDGDPTATPPVAGTALSSLSFASDGSLNPVTAGPPPAYNLSFEVDPADVTDAANVLRGNFPTAPVVQLADPNQVTTGLTNYAGSNSVTFTEQDGFQKGDLIDMSVDGKGQIWGAFTNGKSERLGQVTLAKFTNNEGLVRNGSNFYRESPNSGVPNTGTAVDIFPSTQIAGGSLEQSNVDMTTQFTDMISTQRAYEAAARTITLSDQLLQETTNLKR
jgi:flagellar hook protein FlgE